MTVAEKLSAVNANVTRVYDAGRRGEKRAFWDIFQQCGAKRNYRNAFHQWSDEIYDPQYPIVVSSQAFDVFYYSNVIDTRVPITVTTAMSRFFSQSKNLVTVPLLEVSASVTFSADCFADCTSLETIFFAGTVANDISLAQSPLSRESIESLFEALSTESTGKTLTLNSAAVSTAFGGTESDDWLALIATRPNWNISLS